MTPLISTFFLFLVSVCVVACDEEWGELYRVADAATLEDGGDTGYVAASLTQPYVYAGDAKMCGGISEGNATNNWLFTCLNAKTTFSPTETAEVWLKLSNITTNHRYRIIVYKGGVQQWVYTTDEIVVGSGWNYGFFTPSIGSLSAGNWEARISVSTNQGATFTQLQVLSFTVSGASTPYVYAGDAQMCGGISEGNASNNWLYTCLDAKTTFSPTETARVWLKLSSITSNHRYRIIVYKDGVQQWVYTTDELVVGSGWNYGFFTPSIGSLSAGNWEARISVSTNQGATFTQLQALLFTVSGASTPYVYAGDAKMCGGISEGNASNNWLYTCLNAKTTFSPTETARVWLKLSSITSNHRYRIIVYKGGVQQWVYTTDELVVGSGGWNYGFFTPSIGSLSAGNWEARISVSTNQGATFTQLQALLFTVSGASTPYLYAGDAKMCGGISEGNASNNWLYACLDARTTFLPTETARVWLKLSSITSNHRYRVVAPVKPITLPV